MQYQLVLVIGPNVSDSNDSQLLKRTHWKTLFSPTLCFGDARNPIPFLSLG